MASDTESIGEIIAICIALIVIDAVWASKRKLAVTNKKIYGRTGLIRKTELISPLNQIQNIQIKRGLFGAIFGYGKISVTTASGMYNFSKVKKPAAFRNAVMEQIDSYK